MIKVSIIIPVYNVEKYLSECLDSIFSQTLREIEVVCVNDGSTDKSLEILSKYQEKHDNMVVITQENAGSGRARNMGIDAAKGKYLMFVDPDDFLASEDVLQILYTAAENNGVEVCGASVVCLKEGVISKRFPASRSKSRVEKEGLCFFEDYQYPYAHQRYIIKRMLLLEHNILYPDYRRGQDVPFMAKVLNTAKKCYLVPIDAYVYRSGYKEVKFTVEKADDLVSSLLEVLELSVSSKLKVLYDTMVQEINLFAKRSWYKLLKENDAWEKITRVNEVIKNGNALFAYKTDANCLMDQSMYEEYLQTIQEFTEEIEKKLDKNSQLAVYGAGRRARDVYKYLTRKGYCPNCFVVSNGDGNLKEIERVPVITLGELQNAQEYLFVLGAIYPKTREEMKLYLQRNGCNNILDIDCVILNNLGNSKYFM